VVTQLVAALLLQVGYWIFNYFHKIKIRFLGDPAFPPILGTLTADDPVYFVIKAEIRYADFLKRQNFLAKLSFHIPSLPYFSLPSHGLLDCWINGLLQIKELCKNHNMGESRNAYSEIFLKIQYLWFFLNSKPIIQQSINPLSRHPVG
jgi:hypothetical protein